MFLKRFVRALKFLKGRGFLRLYVDKFFSGRKWWSLCSLSSLIEVKSFSHNPERLSLSVHRLNREFCGMNLLVRWQIRRGSAHARCLTNRFYVAVRLFSNRSQMTSKCGKNKKVAHEAIAEYVTDVLTTFWRLLWSITEQTHVNMELICFI